MMRISISRNSVEKIFNLDTSSKKITNRKSSERTHTMKLEKRIINGQAHYFIADATPEREITKIFTDKRNGSEWLILPKNETGRTSISLKDFEKNAIVEVGQKKARLTTGEKKTTTKTKTPTDLIQFHIPKTFSLDEADKLLVQEIEKRVMALNEKYSAMAKKNAEKERLMALLAKAKAELEAFENAENEPETKTEPKAKKKASKKAN